MSLSTTIIASVRATQRNLSDLGASEFPEELAVQLALGSGADAGQAAKKFFDTRQVAPSGSDSIDLAGALTDANGAAVTFAKIKAIVVRARAGNVNNVVIGNGSNPLVGGPFSADGSNEISLPPGGVFLWADPGANGLAVTASTGDLLKIANSGAGSAVDYDIALIGA